MSVFARLHRTRSNILNEVHAGEYELALLLGPTTDEMRYINSEDDKEEEEEPHWSDTVKSGLAKMEQARMTYAEWILGHVLCCF